MRLVHRVFRSVFADAPALVDSAVEGDRRRAAAVGAHLLDLSRALHRHHETEDSLLWDTIAKRAPACALHVGLMKTQHQRLGAVLNDADSALTDWIASPSAENQTRVRNAMVRIHGLLVEHLGDEEALILPAAASIMTQREWDRLGEFARKETRPSMMFPQLGFLLDSMSPDEAEQFLRSTAPSPLRLLWKTIGVRSYRRYRTRVYGTAA